MSTNSSGFPYFWQAIGILAVIVVVVILFSPLNNFIFATLGVGQTIPTSSTAPSSLNDGLVGHWTFDGEDVDWGDASGEIKDRSGNGNHGDATGDAANNTIVDIGVLGQSLVFEEIVPSDSTQHRCIEVPQSATLDDLTEVTVSVWLKPDRDDYGDWNALIGKGDHNGSGINDGWSLQFGGWGASKAYV